MDFIFSNHALQQINLRNISSKTVERIMENTDQILKQENKLIYQSLIRGDDKDYLIRIFVNHLVDPAVIITAYKTSKINKYL
ncbi:MAG: DUF4258 domain-containing protein [Sphingobacteriaceae bacterium]|nr:MAG: DUF4258 domain-containing protein [Sphingobacteriaceae bacterium]